MTKKMISIFLIFFAYLEGNIESYLRPVPFKQPQNFNPIENVDFAYIVNLDQRPEKYELCKKELSPYNIYPCRFPAVNGWELSFEDLNNLGTIYEPGMRAELWGTSYLPENGFQASHEVMQVVGKSYFCHCMSRGAVGIVLSHLSMLQDALDSGYNTVWIMEDDIAVIRDPHVLSDLISQLDAIVGKDNWDILFTDRDTKNQKGEYVACKGHAYRPEFTPENPIRFQLDSPVNESLRRIGARYGAYSMIVRRSGMEKILNFFKERKFFLPYDMEYTQPNDIALYTVLQDVVSTTPCAASDNGAPNYKNRLIVTE